MPWISARGISGRGDVRLRLVPELARVGLVAARPGAMLHRREYGQMHAVAHAAFGQSFRGFAACVAVAALIGSFGFCPQRASATAPAVGTAPAPTLSPPVTTTPTATPATTSAAEPGSSPAT